MIDRPIAHFVVIGAMKCGTSSLHDQLSLRSGLFMSTPKEPNFFSDEKCWSRGLSWYRGCFAGAHEGQLRGECSTHYSKWPDYPLAAERLHTTLPEVKLVYVMRDPIERIVSQYIHEWSQREVKGKFEEAVLQHGRFTAYSSYARQLERHLEYCETERILLVAFERMLLHPDDELARICTFLRESSPEGMHWNAAADASNISSQRMRRSALRDGLSALPVAGWVKQRLPLGLREVLKRPWRMERRPAISVALRTELARRLDGDLERLGRWTGRELSCARWCEAIAEKPLEWVGGPD